MDPKNNTVHTQKIALKKYLSVAQPLSFIIKVKTEKVFKLKITTGIDLCSLYLNVKPSTNVHRCLSY